MRAARLLVAARAAGLSLQIDGENLIVEADRDLPAELIAELREHKAELMAVLSRRDPESVPRIQKGCRAPSPTARRPRYDTAARPSDPAGAFPSGVSRACECDR